MNEKLSTKFVTPEIICSYPHLHEKSPDLSGRMAYSISIPIPKSDEKAVVAMRQAMSNAAVNAWGEKYAKLEGIKHFVVDGDPEDAVYKDTFKFSAKSIKNRPRCVFPDVRTQVPVERIEEVFYPGCIVRVSVSAYATDAAGPKTIAWSLNNVMFVRDGERIGGGASNPEDDFGDFADSSFSDDPFSSGDSAPGNLF